MVDSVANTAESLLGHYPLAEALTEAILHVTTMRSARPPCAKVLHPIPVLARTKSDASVAARGGPIARTR